MRFPTLFFIKILDFCDLISITLICIYIFVIINVLDILQVKF